MVLIQSRESGCSVNEEKFDVKWIAFNPAPEEKLLFWKLFFNG